MTKEDIKKAFAICCGVQDCTGCPILDMEKQNGLGCKFNLFTRVIDTVSEQEKEIEKLKAEVNKRCDNCETIKQAQIDTLNKVKDMLDNAPNGWAYTTYIDELIEEVENDK